MKWTAHVITSLRITTRGACLIPENSDSILKSTSSVYRIGSEAGAKGTNSNVAIQNWGRCPLPYRPFSYLDVEYWVRYFKFFLMF